MTTPSKTTARTNAGFTILEMLIGASILFLLAGALLQSMTGLRRVTGAGAAESRVQDRAQRAMARIVDDLRSSGFILRRRMTWRMILVS